MPNIEGLRSFTPPQNEMQRVINNADANNVPPLPDKKRIHLSPRQQEILNLTALGLSRKEIGEKMNVSLDVIKADRAFLYNAFNANNMLAVVIKGVETGNIDLDELTKDLNKNDISKLFEREREVLDVITRNGGKNSDYKAIASVLRLSTSSVKTRLGDIVEKLGINKTRAALLYLGYKKENNLSEENTTTPKEKLIHLSPRQQEILNLTALGLSRKEIGEKMGVLLETVKGHNGFILNAFGAYTMLEAVIKGVETGNIDLDELTKDLDKNDISKLSEREKEVLDAMVQNGGENSSNKEIVSFLHINKEAVTCHLRNIVKKLGTNKTRAALLYLAYKRENTLPDL